MQAGFLGVILRATGDRRCFLHRSRVAPPQQRRKPEFHVRGTRTDLACISYEWHFQPEASKTWTDNGTRACHAGTPVGNDFSLTASPSSLSAAPGQAVTSSIATTVISGATQGVALGFSGLPAAASASLDPATVSAGRTSTLRHHHRYNNTARCLPGPRRQDDHP